MAKNKNMNGLDITATTLVLAGAINWGAIALARFDLVETLTSYTPEGLMLNTIIKGAVGVAGVYSAYRLLK